MAQLTDKGLARLESLRDFFPPKHQYSSVKMRTKYLLKEVEQDPEFHIEQHSILRPDWNRLKDQGLIADTTAEPIYVIEGTDRPLYRGETERFVKITRPSDSSFIGGQIVPKQEFDAMVEAIERQGGEVPLGEAIGDWR